MRLLVVGNGAREHAIVWKLSKSNKKPEIFVAPGNAGTETIAINVPIELDDIENLLEFAKGNQIDLTIVGPEIPLVKGIVNDFNNAGLRIFGPTKEAALIEGSKSFSKQIMNSAGAPTAPFSIFDNYYQAKEYILEKGAPIVIKADGLAAGKGVVVAQSVDEALEALHAMMVERIFGTSGDRVVIEDCLSGPEVSVFCFTDGSNISSLVAACDYKRAYDDNKGPNTGGMGGYSPPSWWNAKFEKLIRETCIKPVIDQMALMGCPYSGILYGGLMLTEQGPSIIEFNARLGDPEAEFILPRLENDLIEVIDALLNGDLNKLELKWEDNYIVGVVLASGGYPGKYEIDLPIHGLKNTLNLGQVFHAGTRSNNGETYTAGGRVLTAIGKATTMKEARINAYKLVEKINFENMQYRTDIAQFANDEKVNKEKETPIA